LSEADAGVEREDARSGFIVMGTEAVGAAVGGVERRMSLKNEVGLGGEPEAGVVEMGKHGFRSRVWRDGGSVRG